MADTKLRFVKWDIVPLAAVALLAALLFLLFLPKAESAAPYAEIYQNSELVKTVPLTENGTFTVTGDYNNTVTVRDGKIAVTASDCPGGDCLTCGWQGTAGRSIVCLPNGLEIRIVASSGGVDFVVG